MTNIPKTIKTAEGWSVEGAGAELLAELLAQYTHVLSQSGFQMDVLVDGIDGDHVRRATQSVGLGCPDELVTWFGWQNGLRRDSDDHLIDVLPLNYVPASVEWATGNYEYLRRNSVPLGLWAEGWLSLEEGEGFAIYCDGSTTDACLVRRAFTEEYDFVTEYEPYQTVSLCTIVAWWLEALTTHAIWQQPGGTGWEFDPAKCRVIDRGTLMLG